MPTTPGNRQRSLLIGVAAAALALAAVSWRMVGSARAAGLEPVPTADLDGLTGFLAPLTDTSVLAHVGNGTMVVARDPFAPSIVEGVRGPVGTSAKAVRPMPGERQQWVVSSILFEGSKRSAIVNNAWVTVGDALGGGSRLTAVERKHIVVTDAKGVRHVVPIQGGES